MVPWIFCVILIAVTGGLGAKIIFMKKSIDEISTMFRERLLEETNTQIRVSSGDKHIRKLAEEMNQELLILGRQRRKYLKGDRELKEAVTNISHDLRTPLTAISGYLELLEGEEKSRDAERYLSFVKDRTQAMKALTEELFSYTVVRTAELPKPEEVDISRVLEESLLSFFGAMTQKGIVPEIKLPRERVIRRLNPAALNRVFGNVLSNAVKYSEGDLMVELLENGEVRFSNRAPDLDKVQVEKLFDRFFTVEGARYSTGLGLSIAKSLTQQMGGRIFAEYKNGKLIIHLFF